MCELLNELTDLNSVIFFIADINKSQGIRCDAPGVVKTTIASALAAKSPKKSARWV